MMNFQHWLHEKWLEHCEEYLQWCKQMPMYDISEYYERYRDWLNEQYSKDQNNNDGTDSKTHSKE
jgi:uncharacterized protein CbrC (UPF0167 family)